MNLSNQRVTNPHMTSMKFDKLFNSMNKENIDNVNYAYTINHNTSSNLTLAENRKNHGFKVPVKPKNGIILPLDPIYFDALESSGEQISAQMSQNQFLVGPESIPTYPNYDMPLKRCQSMKHNEGIKSKIGKFWLNFI